MIAETLDNVIGVFHLLSGTFMFFIDLNYEFVLFIYKLSMMCISMISYVFKIFKYCTKTVYNFVYNLLKTSIAIEQYVKLMLQSFFVLPNFELTYGLDLLDLIIVFSLFSSFLIIKLKLKKQLAQRIQINDTTTNNDTNENNETNNNNDVDENNEDNDNNNDTSLLNESIYLCCICQVENSVIVFMPCKHLCTCEPCYDAMKVSNHNDCPVCRCKIKNIIKVFV